MNRTMAFPKLSCLLAPLLGLVLACGGGGGGGGTSAPNPPLAPGMFETENLFQVNLGDYTGNWADYHSSFHWQNLYDPGHIHGSGWMTGLSIKYGADMPTAVTCQHVTIRLSHSHLSDLSTVWGDNLDTGEGGQTTVLEDRTLTFPAGIANTWHPIPFDTPFYYNGEDALLVDTTYYGPCSDQVNDACTTNSGHYTTLRAGAYAAFGTLETTLPFMRWHFRGGTSDIRRASGLSNNNNPFRTDLFGRKVQQLYTPSQVKGSGPITGFGLQVDATAAEQQFTVTVKLGHSTLADLTTRFADNFNQEPPVTAASDATFKVPAGLPEGSWIWLPFPGEPFTYDGTRNLLMEIEVTAATGNLFLKHGFSGNPIRLYGNLGSATGQTDAVSYGTRLRFAGGSVDVISGGTTSPSFFPLNETFDNRIQSLYRATELGQKGTITKVAFRLWNEASDSSSYPLFTVKLGHTSNTSLGTTFAQNMPGAKTVFSGTLAVPGGMKGGEWIEVPLATPFAYNGRSNLAIEVSTQKGAFGNIIRVGDDPVLFTHRHALATNRTATEASSLPGILPHLRIMMD